MVGKVILGSLKGNAHGLGKDIVAATLRDAGFQVVDLGVDVSPEKFVDAAIQENAKIIGISISVDETVLFLKDVIQNLRQKKMKRRIGVVVGGQAVSERTCEEYEVDAYAKDAEDCVKKVTQLMRGRALKSSLT